MQARRPVWRQRGQAIVMVAMMLPIIIGIVGGMFSLIVITITVERLTSVSRSIADSINNDFDWKQSNSLCPPVHDPHGTVGPTRRAVADALRAAYADRPLVPAGWASVQTVDDLYARMQVTTVCGDRLHHLPPACRDRLADAGWSEPSTDPIRRIRARITCVTIPSVQIDIPFPFIPDLQVPITVVAVSSP